MGIPAVIVAIGGCGGCGKGVKGSVWSIFLVSKGVALASGWLGRFREALATMLRHRSQNGFRSIIIIPPHVFPFLLPTSF